METQSQVKHQTEDNIFPSKTSEMMERYLKTLLTDSEAIFICDLRADLELDFSLSDNLLPLLVDVAPTLAWHLLASIIAPWVKVDDL